MIRIEEINPMEDLTLTFPLVNATDTFSIMFGYFHLYICTFFKTSLYNNNITRINTLFFSKKQVKNCSKNC